MSKLPPLQVPKKPVGLSSNTGTVTVCDLPEGVSGKVEIGNLAKQTAELLQVEYTFLSLFIIPCCHVNGYRVRTGLKST